MPCETFDGGVICRSGPQKLIHHEHDGFRWCFRCRKQRDFWFDVWAEIEPSWYGPNPSIRCGCCSTVDGDLFPGRAREWED